ADVDLQIIQARQKVEAAEQLKDAKFAVGEARFAEKAAKFRAGESVARASMQDEEILEPEPTQARPRSVSTAQTLALLIETLEREIDEAEAAGKPTEQLRLERDGLNAVLRRELIKS